MAAAMLCALAATASAASMLTGEVGRWLNATAVPALVETLSKHPRFRGETVRVVAMRDGKPVPTPDRLTQEVERELTHRLAASAATRIALPDAPRGCELREEASYVLGVEVTPLGNGAHRVSIAMVDVEEGVWVNGLNLRWEGSLTRTQRSALAERPDPAAPGSFGHPIPLEDRPAVVEHLRTQMECALRSGWAGRIALEPPKSDALVPILRELASHAGSLPGVAVAPAGSASEWWLAGDLVDATSSGHAELIVTIAPREGEAPTQRLASLWITSPRFARTETQRFSKLDPSPAPATAAAVDASDTSRSAAPVLETDPASLITPLRTVASPARGACVNHDGSARCIDVELDLARDAYLFVFYTRNQNLHMQACRGSLQRTKAGPHRYRLTFLEHHEEGPGIYAVATRDRDMARALNDVLRMAPGACSAAMTTSAEAWFARFRNLVDRYKLRLEWRSLHLSEELQAIASR